MFSAQYASAGGAGSRNILDNGRKDFRLAGMIPVTSIGDDPGVGLDNSTEFVRSGLFFFAKNDIYATIELMKESFITTSSKQTQKMGEILAKELKGCEIICLTGELGSGKTTFAQGILKGLGAKGPYTSPTFVVMKHYKVESRSIYHIDAYRVGTKDILDLGWEEIVANKNNIVIVEWAERIRGIIPKRAIWLGFEHLKEDEREISICKNFK